MAYSNVWNENVPADGSAANQLGVVIRQFKEDIAQRVESFGAGLFADRPTPESAFGQANFGVMYYATDTGILYRWNGSSWSILSGRAVNSTTTTSNNPIGGTYCSVDVPANSFRVGTIVKSRAWAVIQNTGGSAVNLSYVIASQGLFDIEIPNNSSTYQVFCEFTGIVTSATVLKIGGTMSFGVAGAAATLESGGGAGTTIALASSTNFSLLLTGNLTGVLTSHYHFVEFE